MLSRRTLIGKAAVGAATVLAVGSVGTTGVAATRSLRNATGDASEPTDDFTGALDAPSTVEPSVDAAATTAPAPWSLVAPFGAGATVAHGWSLTELTPVQDGSAVVTMQNERGHAHRIHLCRNDGTPEGVIHTGRVDLVVMNQGYGELPTDEHFGQAVAALAHAIAANEGTLPNVVAELLPHAERVQRFAAVDGPSGDGKLR